MHDEVGVDLRTISEVSVVLRRELGDTTDSISSGHEVSIRGKKRKETGMVVPR